MTDPVRSRASNGGATDTLYNLLPAVYRLRDAAEGEPLRALLAVAEAEFDLLKADIQGLYGNWFVETCDEWVVPYIGDLLGVRGMQPVGSGKQFSQRGFVANTLAYRRRKGTVAVLEQLGRDITGWPAKAVEFFSRLITTQNINHVRRNHLATLSLREANPLELVGGPFETAGHTAEVRHIDNGRGRYNIPHVGIFLWRLQAYEIRRGTARPAGARARRTLHVSPARPDHAALQSAAGRGRNRGPGRRDQRAGAAAATGAARRADRTAGADSSRAILQTGTTSAAHLECVSSPMARKCCLRN